MKRQQLAAIVTAILLVGSMGGIASADYATAPSVDTSGTDDTASTSEVAPGDTLGNNNTFEANSSQNSTFQWISDSNSTKAESYRENSSNIAWSDANPTTVFYNTTDNDGHFNGSMDHSAILDTDHAPGENVTMKVKFYNNTSASSPATSNETYYVEWDNSTSVQHIDDSDVSSGNIATVKSDSVSVLNRNLTIGPLGDDSSTIETNERTVNGSNTDVYVTFSNQSVVDDFDSAASDASAGDKLSGFSLTRNVVLVKDSGGEWTAVPVYNSEAASDMTENDTYAVYGTYGGSNGVQVNLGSDFDNSSAVTVKAVGGGGMLTHIDDYVSTRASGLMG